MKISERFQLGRKLGQGTFSNIYEAYDKTLKQNVALKIEKKDKNKSILIFEYSVLNMLKGLQHVCSAYDFVKNTEQNLIVMDLLGNNLAKVRKCLEDSYSLKIAVQLLIEMLDAIEEVHDRGFIHRDVKASNFVLSRDNKQVFIVDFGLAKKHLDDKKQPMAQRKKADFRGTVSFASLNAHNNIDLSRRDDLWSLYFVILDFLNEKLKWREQKEYTMDEVKHIKTDCINNPEQKLWIATKEVPEVREIFYHIQSLRYEDVPDYALIRNALKSILSRNVDIPAQVGRPGQSPPFVLQTGRQPQEQALYHLPGSRTGHHHIAQSSHQPLQTFAVYQNPYQSQRQLGYPIQTSIVNHGQDFQAPQPQNHARYLPISHSFQANASGQNKISIPTSTSPAGHHQYLNQASFSTQSKMNSNNFGSQQKQVLTSTPLFIGEGVSQDDQKVMHQRAQSYYGAYNLQQHQQTKTSANQQILCGNQSSQPQDFNGSLIIQQSQKVGQNLISIPASQQPADKKKNDLKRKGAQPTFQLEQIARHEQIQANEVEYGNNCENLLGNKRNAKQTVKIQSKKRDSKKQLNQQLQPQIHIIPDEEPLTVQQIIETALANENAIVPQTQQSNNQQAHQQQQQYQQNLTVPQGAALPIFQFSPQNASSVNQQISISQNFYLQPNYLLLLHDHPEHTQQIIQQAALAAQASGQTFPIQSQLPLSTTGGALLANNQNASSLFNSTGNTDLLNNLGVTLNNQQGAIYNKLLSQAQNFTTGGVMTAADNGVYNFSQTQKQQFRKETVEAYGGEANKLLNEEKLHENNPIPLGSDNANAVQIRPNSQKPLQGGNVISLTQPTTNAKPNSKNNQGTFANILSQRNSTVKIQKQPVSQIPSKKHPPLPLGSNTYYYDPDMIERQNMPCFRVEKTATASKSKSSIMPNVSAISRNASTSQSNAVTPYTQIGSSNTQGLKSGMIMSGPLSSQDKLLAYQQMTQSSQNQILGHPLSQPLLSVANSSASNHLLLSGLGLHQNMTQYHHQQQHSAYQGISQFLPQQILQSKNV